MEKQTGRRAYPRSRGQKELLGERERARLAQLGVCLALFLAVFLAKGVDRLAPLREELAQAVRLDANFDGALTDLGWAVAARRPVGETLGELWQDVFLPKAGTVAQSSARPATLTAPKSPGALLGVEEADRADPMAASVSLGLFVPEPEPTPTPEPEVVHVDYTGPALPDNTTMDRYALGLAATQDPVDGVLTSAFGWREHPIEGVEKFHYGLDLAVETGTTVAAFANGTVDYIGESDAYGLYLQIDHGNGVKSFYAHCSKLCVQQGEPVAMGEKVAESGATGEVTGPHLHFELKRQGVRLNPAYYVDYRQ